MKICENEKSSNEKIETEERKKCKIISENDSEMENNDNDDSDEDNDVDDNDIERVEDYTELPQILRKARAKI